MFGIVLFLYGLYCVFRCGFHWVFGGLLGHFTGLDTGSSGAGCSYFVKAAVAFSLAAFCGLAEI